MSPCERSVLSCGQMVRRGVVSAALQNEGRLAVPSRAACAGQYIPTDVASFSTEIEFSVHTGVWPSDEGPAPGKKDCRVPEHILDKYSLKNAQTAEIIELRARNVS